MDGGFAPLAGESIAPLPGPMQLPLRELAARIAESFLAHGFGASNGGEPLDVGRRTRGSPLPSS